jgi:hypothetical protein
MNKILLILIVLFSTNCFSQSVSKIKFEKQYENIINNLENENWKKAFKSTSKLVSKIEKDSIYRYETKVLKYILIYSTAGMLNEKELTKDQALSQVKNLKGATMVMPAHPFNSNCYVNCTQLSDERPNTFFSGVNNGKGTQIFSFEYIKIENGISETREELEGKFIILQGVLNEISVEGNIFPRFKLEFNLGKYEIYKE